MLQPKVEGIRIGRWLSLGYIVPTVVIVASGIAIWPQMRMLHDKTDAYSNFVADLERIDEMSLNVQIASRATRGYLLSPEPISLDTYRTAQARLLELERELESSSLSAEQQEIFATLYEDVAALDALNDRITNLVSAGNAEAALELWQSDDGREIIERISQQFDRIRARQVERVDLLESEQQQSLNTLMIVAGVASLTLIAVAVALNVAISNLISKQLARASSSIVSSSAQIAATVAAQERSTNQQAASVNETTTTMDELNASARQVLEKAEAATASAREALEESEAGTRAVESTLESMMLLKDKVGAIAQQILHLNEQTNQIGNISTLVSDLANQTNMLALNAAVEAVRAGEHGRGFSVVASEIRKLADRSKQSAGQIGGLVADIQSAIGSTVMVTDEGTKTVDAGVARSQETSEALSNVRNASDRVVLNNQQITLTIEQQAAAIQQVVDAMNALNSAAHESASGISQVRTGTELLNNAAEDLTTIV